MGGGGGKFQVVMVMFSALPPLLNEKVFINVFKKYLKYLPDKYCLMTESVAVVKLNDRWTRCLNGFTSTTCNEEILIILFLKYVIILK